MKELRWRSADDLLHEIGEREIEELNRVDPAVLFQFGITPGLDTEILPDHGRAFKRRGPKQKYTIPKDTPGE